MISIHNIRTVARYEAKTLRRSWLFRLFSILAFGILTLMNIGLFSPIGDEEWNFMAIPSSMPLLNLYILNIAQSLIIIFLASDFLKRDKKLDTNEVLYTRPMSNMEYIFGKSLGILRLFLGVNILILVVCLIINIISKRAGIDVAAYFEYLFIISIPTLIFSLGFAYILMSIIRNQAVTFLLLLGFAALNMFYLFNRMGSFFDYMLFGFPVFKSALTGFSNINILLAHRIMYTSLGLAFIFVTILVFKRLPQSRTHRLISLVSLSVFLIISAYSAYYFLDNYYDNRNLKNKVIEINSKYENSDFLRVTDADIEIEYSGHEISARAGLKCLNNNDIPVSEALFSLNPGLSVKEVTVNGSTGSFSPDGHVLLVDLGSGLQPDSSINISFAYEGVIEEAYCYPWYNDDIKEQPFRIGPVNVDKKQVIQKDEFLLLTPETHWYPVAGLNFYPSSPAKILIDFTNYTLRVKRNHDLVAISQGKRTSDENYWYFDNENPLTGISLVEGNYISDTISVDSTDFIAHYYRDHDYFREDLNELGDTLGNLISGIMTELETNFSTEYPFERLSLVEVPVYFHSVEKKNTQTRAEVQPSMILVPEKLSTINEAGFYRTIKRQKRRMERGNQVITDKELQVRAFNNFVRNTFITSSNMMFYRGNTAMVTGRYLMGPSFYFYKNNFYSDEYPVMNAVFETHLQKVETPRGGGFQRMFMGGLSENDRANTILRDHSMEEILALNPSNDTTRLILTVKGDYLFNLIREEVGIEEFNTWFSHYLEENKFKNISIKDFSHVLYDNYGFNLETYLDQWYRGKGQPGFLFSDITVNEVVVGTRTRYKVSFTASNPEETAGIFNVGFRTGGRGPGGGRGMQGNVSITVSGGGRGNIYIGMEGRGMQTNDVEKIIKLEAGQAKRVSVILDAQPRGMFVNTLFSVNNPGELQFPLTDLTEGKTEDNTEGQVILDRIPLLHEENEIIVDNEDPGFRMYQETSSGRLKQWLKIGGDDGNDYREMFIWWAPEYWQKTVESTYYGKYVKSAIYTRAGTGERYISWTAEIEEPGYYDVYTYIGKRGGQRVMMGRGGENRNTMQDLHFSVEHDDGTEEVIVDWENAESGWNLLGSYYLSPDSAKVMMTNQSEGRTVTGDAIKWVKQNSYK
jgi:ABC-type transport system involved in multi-copper enzyme maturation permease subunit